MSCALSFSAICLLPTEAQKLPYYASYGHVRSMIHTLCTNHYLDLIITFIIAINVITMSLEHYNQPYVSLCVGGVLICVCSCICTCYIRHQYNPFCSKVRTFLGHEEILAGPQKFKRLVLRLKLGFS